MSCCCISSWVHSPTHPRTWDSTSCPQQGLWGLNFLLSYKYIYRRKIVHTLNVIQNKFISPFHFCKGSKMALKNCTFYVANKGLELTGVAIGMVSASFHLLHVVEREELKCKTDVKKGWKIQWKDVWIFNRKSDMGLFLAFHLLDNETFLFYLSVNVHDHTIYCLSLIICCVRNANVSMISGWEKRKKALNPASVEFWAEITPHTHTYNHPHLRNSLILFQWAGFYQ